MANKKEKDTSKAKESTLQELNIDHFAYQTMLTKKFGMRKPYAPPVPGLLTAFIPGVITEVFVRDGQMVKKGEKLVSLEAMKMLNEIMAPSDGTIKSILVQQGDKVSKNQPLLEIELKSETND